MSFRQRRLVQKKAEDSDEDMVVSDLTQSKAKSEDDLEMLDSTPSRINASGGNGAMSEKRKENGQSSGSSGPESGKRLLMVGVHIPLKQLTTNTASPLPFARLSNANKQLSMHSFLSKPGSKEHPKTVFAENKSHRAKKAGSSSVSKSKKITALPIRKKIPSSSILAVSDDEPDAKVDKSGDGTDDDEYAPPPSEGSDPDENELLQLGEEEDEDSPPDIEALEISDEEDMKPKTAKLVPKKAPGKRTALPSGLNLPNKLHNKTADNLPPLHDIALMFEDIVSSLPQLVDVAKKLGKRKLRVATMCSGTESPLLALGLVSRAMKKTYGMSFEIDHVFSCEIEPFKQAYIERNFQPPILFRDVTELGNDVATTAYGAEVPVPMGVDVLIAGTSCVDYSNLNNKKLDLDDGGESGRTFAGMLAWVVKARPPVVILENVLNGPWDRMAQKFEAKGYSAHFERLDTKNYYIPHTRMRGYMFCLNVNGSKLSRQWGTAMKDLVRPASCSLESFLLPGDDPRIHQARQNLVKTERGVSKTGRTVDWTRCETRHQKTRLEERLGNRRPLTFWQEAGVCKLPDFAWGDWGSAQVERVLDLMDILYIKNAKLGIDASYKTQVWNLSQNVDRNVGGGKPGICPCLTPTMIPYLANRGGPMVGLEALSMQGLPIDELLLTKETEDQLADLAGNAMSSTVVGTAILAALVLAKDHLEKGEESNVEVEEARDDISKRIAGDEQLHKTALDLFSIDEFPILQLVTNAQNSRRLCNCEGREQMTSNNLNVCADCGFSSCENCGGRPEHNYIPFPGVESRISPAIFSKQLKRALPMRLKLSGIDGSSLEDLRNAGTMEIPEKSWKVWKQYVVKALSGELRFRSLKRQETWSATYEAPHARLELHLDPKQPEWRLYAKPDDKEPSNSLARRLLSQYFARMRIRKYANASVLDGEWQVCLPGTRAFNIEVQGVGDLVPSWESQLGLQDRQWADKKVWSKLEITVSDKDRKKLDRDISGIYTLHDRCGTANSALHKREASNDDEAPLFFFLDPTRCGPPKDDPFVFSASTKRYAIGEERPIVAKLDSAWRQTSSSGVKQVKCLVEGEWLSIAANLQPPSAGIDNRATFATPDTNVFVQGSNNACKTAQAILICKVPMEGQAEKVWPRGRWVEIDKIHERGTYETLAWLTERIGSLDQLSEWRVLELPSDLCNCERCAPTEPDLKWVLVRNKIIPMEDSKQAGPYEQALKNRPSPFVTQLHHDEVSDVGTLRIGLNVATLLHRSLARLPPADLRSGTPRLSWRLNTDYSPPIKLSLPRFKLTSNRQDKPALQPPRFIINLRPEQLRSLSWMLRQEEDDAPPFIEEEVTEALLPNLGWKAEGKAERPVYVKGGVLADEVGYGKTAITIGLIDASRDRISKIVTPELGFIPIKATLIVVPPHLTNQWPSEIRKFTGQSYHVLKIQNQAHLNAFTIADIQKADIIVVACTLFKSDKYLSNMAALAAAAPPPAGEGRRFDAWLKVTLEKLRGQVDDLQENGASFIADIIEASRQDAVHGFEEGFIQGKRLKGQAYRDNQGDNVSSGPAAKGKKRPSPKRKRKESDDSASEEQMSIDEDSETGKKGKGKTTTAQKPTTRGIETGDPWKLKSKLVRNDWKLMHAPPLDMFHFKRLVVDEYTYLKGQIHSGITNLSSTYKWVLSGTPPIDDFADVKTISIFLAIQLGIDDGAAAKLANRKKIEKEKTAVEKFNSFREVRSPAWHERRHAVAQNFLNQFVRQNIAEIDEIPFEEHIVPIHLPAAERAIYLELEHHLQALDMNIKKGKAKQGNDREKRLQESLGESASAEEALLKRCSHFDLDITEKDQENAMKACEVIVRDRTKGLASLMGELKEKLEAQFQLQRSIPNLGGEETFFGAYCRLTREKGVGDADASQYMLALMDIAWGKSIDGLENLKRSLRASGIAIDKYFWFSKGKSKESELSKLANTTRVKGKPKAKRRKKISDDSDEPETDGDEIDVEPIEPLIPKTREEKLQLLRDNTHNVKRLQKEMVGRVRSLRYFKLVRDLQQDILEQAQESRADVSCPSCKRNNLPASEIAVLSSCGHMGCYACLIEAASKEECVAQGCEAAARILNVVKGDTLGIEDKSDGIGRRYGIKLEKLITLIKGKIPREEKVLVFVQFPDLMQKVSEALSQHGIPHLQIKGSSQSKSKSLEAFQSSSGAVGERVLLLNVMDESASGANLTNSNHAIFLSPLLTNSQYEYNACETQAIGRVRRYGQTKTVHIWKFLTMNSIDVEIWQERTQRNIDDVMAYDI